MKKGINKTIITMAAVCMLLLLTGGLAYRSGQNLTRKKYEKQMEQMAKDYEAIIGQLKEDTEAAGQEADASQEKDQTEQAEGTEPEGAEQEEAADAGYKYEGFEEVFSPVCTEWQLDTIKEAAADAISGTEYEQVKKISCSSYTVADPENGSMTGYARLGKKGVLEITYSIRYGKPTARISDYTQKELSDLEQYGRIMDVDSTETVAPRPIETPAPAETETPIPQEIQGEAGTQEIPEIYEVPVEEIPVE